MRKAELKRKTNETDIEIKLNIDGSGIGCIDTGCGFLNHMLTLFAKHARFDLAVSCDGDTEVDYHHTTEDIGICLGLVLKEALGDMRGIERYAHIILPMDEALILCAVDVSGRPHLEFEADIPTAKVGDFDTELCEEFMLALVRNAGITLHIKHLAGKNSHHIIEAVFKALGRVLSSAAKINEEYRDEIPSTKGVI